VSTMHRADDMRYAFVVGVVGNAKVYHYKAKRKVTTPVPFLRVLVVTLSEASDIDLCGFGGSAGVQRRHVFVAPAKAAANEEWRRSNGTHTLL
jgi:hypothetical protein